MAAPSVSWTDLETLKPLVDHASGLTTTMVGYVVNNQEWLLQVSVNDASYTGNLPHSHAADGNSGAALDNFGATNLLFNATPRKSMSWAWVGTNWSATTDWNFHLNVPQTGDADDSIHQFITNPYNSSETLEWFGDGSDLVGSMFIRSTTPLSAGQCSFGIADGGVTQSDYPTGFQAVIDYTEITSSWQRFYAVFPLAGNNHSTDVRFLFRIDTSFLDDLSDATVLQFTGFMCTQGKVLTPFMFSQVDRKSGAGNVNDTHENFHYLPDAPIFDKRISMRDAVMVTPE